MCPEFLVSSSSLFLNSMRVYYKKYGGKFAWCQEQVLFFLEIKNCQNVFKFFFFSRMVKGEEKRETGKEP